MVPSDNLLAHPKSETGSCHPFCRIKRFEHPLLSLLGHSGTGICNSKQEPLLSRTPIVPAPAPHDETPASGLHRVCRIPNKIAEDLSDLSIETADRLRGTVTSFNANPGVDHPSPMNAQNFLDQAIAHHLSGLSGLFVKAKRLVGDVGSSPEFLIGIHQKLNSDFKRLTRPSQIDQVSHSFEWVVDLMSDGSGQTAHGRQLL